MELSKSDSATVIIDPEINSRRVGLTSDSTPLTRILIFRENQNEIFFYFSCCENATVSCYNHDHDLANRSQLFTLPHFAGKRVVTGEGFSLT